MAVASDLPQLENRAEYRRAENSTLLGEPTGKGKKPEDLAKLTGNQNRILVKDADISTNMENAVIAIEDRRFYEHEGVDYKGIARALSQDVLRRSAVQGGSTITQQFVKNAMAAQSKRTVFQKLREAALAYHLERKWTKQKVLTQYLNSVYFGNGAYGVEAAARTYFGGNATETTGPTGQPVDAAAARPGGRAAESPGPGPDPGPGRAAGRDHRLAEPVRPGREPAHRQAPARPRAGQHARPADDHRVPVPRLAGRRAAGRERGDPAAAGVAPALLHHLADPAAGGPLQGPRGVQRRPEGADDAGPRAAGRGRGGHQRPAERRGPERVAGGDREQDRARSARWSGVPTTRTSPSTWPPTATASPARRSSRSR